MIKLVQLSAVSFFAPNMALDEACKAIRWTYPVRDHFHKVAQETGLLHIIKRIITLRKMLTPLCWLLVDGTIRIMRRVLREFRLIRGRCSGGPKDPRGARGRDGRM